MNDVSVVMIVTTGLITAVGSQSTAAPRQNVLFLNGFPENFTSDSAIDVQYTSCKVITDRIVATAEGKFSRFCHGICNINETNARLHRIETLLTTDAEIVKNRLFQLERMLLDVNNLSKRYQYALAGPNTGRLREISTYNGTVSTGPAASPAFIYYWRVDAFWRLAFADGRARSPSFYVSPRSYRMALTVDSDVSARTVRVAAVPAAGEYDAQLRWPFVHRLRISVLDQTDTAPEDVMSRVWDAVQCQLPQRRVDGAGGGGGGGNGVCASMEFRHDVLTYRRYVADDALIVKLTVFMES